MSEMIESTHVEWQRGSKSTTMSLWHAPKRISCLPKHSDGRHELAAAVRRCCSLHLLEHRLPPAHLDDHFAAASVQNSTTSHASLTRSHFNDL